MYVLNPAHTSQIIWASGNSVTFETQIDSTSPSWCVLIVYMVFSYQHSIDGPLPMIHTWSLADQGRTLMFLACACICVACTSINMVSCHCTRSQMYAVPLSNCHIEIHLAVLPMSYMRLEKGGGGGWRCSQVGVCLAQVMLAPRATEYRTDSSRLSVLLGGSIGYCSTNSVFVNETYIVCWHW